jgi:hypothetical protein
VDVSAVGVSGAAKQAHVRARTTIRLRIEIIRRFIILASQKKLENDVSIRLLFEHFIVHFSESMNCT